MRKNISMPSKNSSKMSDADGLAFVLFTAILVFLTAYYCNYHYRKLESKHKTLINKVEQLGIGHYKVIDKEAVFTIRDEIYEKREELLQIFTGGTQVNQSDQSIDL